MNKLICVFLVSMLTAPLALAQDRYIADKLFTYMHSGPSNQYRIIGSVDAGEKVKLLKADKDTGYTEVVDQRGRTGWVESRFITNQESIADRLPMLAKELKDVKAKLANAESNADSQKAGLAESLDARNQQISDLEQKYSNISDKLTKSQSEIRQLRARIDTQKDDLLQKWFMYGGGVAGGGLIFGLLLPHLIPRRKKKHAEWA